VCLRWLTIAKSIILKHPRKERESLFVIFFKYLDVVQERVVERNSLLFLILRS